MCDDVSLRKSTSSSAGEESMRTTALEKMNPTTILEIRIGTQNRCNAINNELLLLTINYCCVARYSGSLKRVECLLKFYWNAIGQVWNFVCAKGVSSDYITKMPT